MFEYEEDREGLNDTRTMLVALFCIVLSFMLGLSNGIAIGKNAKMRCVKRQHKNKSVCQALKSCGLKSSFCVAGKKLSLSDGHK